jgi:hypothetical protein
MRARRTAVGIVTAALGIALSACDPTIWDGIRKDAPVLVLETPAGRAGAFGTVITTYEATVGGTSVSRFAVAGGVNGGMGSTYYVFFGFDGEGAMARPRIDEGAAFVGCDLLECGTQFGTSIAAIPEWRVPGGAVLRGCVAVPSIDTGTTHVRCEEQPLLFQTIGGVPGVGFGASGVGIAHPFHRAGAAIFGAPLASGGDGTLYRMQFDGAPPIEIDLSAAAVPAGGAIGTRVTAAPIDARSLVLATWAPATTGSSRVVVATLDVDDGGVASLAIRACLEGPRGYGAGLALGDLDDDGTLDLAVGTEEVAVLNGVDVYDLDGFPASTTCGAAGQPMPAVHFDCEDVATDEVTCDAPIGLGAALAIGDVDGDEVADLVVGAPLASPGGRTGAGAVAVLGGEAGTLAGLGRRRSTLWHTAQSAGGGLGATLALLRGQDRNEILAGAPRGGEVVIFLCSGLDGDTPETVDGQRGCLGGP